MFGPDPDLAFPLSGVSNMCFLKPLITRPNIEVGAYTYYHDFEDVANFERNVRYHFDFRGDRLVIGKFCMLASGVTFIMNGGNHLTDAISTYPFAIFGQGWEGAMAGRAYPDKGDTCIGNDVWIGSQATIMMGITIGDGAIVATNSTVTKDVPPYAVVGGNPAQVLRMRFPPEAVDQLLAIKWWDWPADKLARNVNLLTRMDIAALQLAE
jgi:virginiamycin A acetyltransferase